MKRHCLEVWGSYASFNRPEMKVERVSYDVITPSAARGIFEAIFWKPAIRWNVRRIEVLKKIRWASIRRNEVGKIMTNSSKGIFIEEERQQRAGMILRDVQYRLYADFDFIPPEKQPKSPWHVPEELQDGEETEILSAKEERLDEKAAKYASMFVRRAKKGQYFHHPYLGTREFECSFRLVENPEREEIRPIAQTQTLGWMLYDLDFSDPKNIRPLFFHAEMKDGVIEVPDRHSEEVRG